MRILVAIPTKDTVDAEAAIAAANLDPCGHELEYAHANGRGVYGIAQARKCVSTMAISGGFDYLLMIDSDTIVPRDALKHLLDPEVDIVLGLYRYKNETGDSPFFRFVPDENGSVRWRFDDVPDGRFEIKNGGLGCSLVKVDVFNRIAKPFFHFEERASGCHTSEDIWFLDRCRNAGMTIWADGRVKCKHAGRKVYA